MSIGKDSCEVFLHSRLKERLRILTEFGSGSSRGNIPWKEMGISLLKGEESTKRQMLQF